MSASPFTGRPFSSLLVANRGEIARRVIRTAKTMGLRCVAVYAASDAGAPFVHEADEAVLLPGGYLDVDAVLAAAARTGAQAVHPGYGFLSENAAFAAAVQRAGLVWVGPSPAVIESMGDKLEAKRVAIRSGVPTLPSSDDPTDDASVGYPLLVKAAAGGGGKGMRVVDAADRLAESVAAARREALGGFGDDRVFLERYVPHARHVEVQILGDAHGALVHLGERECSIQRRHQKIVEESPSPALNSERRAAMGDAAVTLARTLGYESAGTVEFLVDDDSGEFFFLEVNTRLQVEHPVTEAVTGLDLVREQLRIAMGEPLGYEQTDVEHRGHAIEVRLYAEDPAAGFLPATGTLVAFEPEESDVRWDSGVATGSVIGVDFDPMLAKVIAHARTRHEAAAVLARALERLHIGGVTTNRDFLVATLRHPAFLAGATTTDFIEREAPEPVTVFTDDELRHAATLAALWIQGTNRAAATVLAAAPSGWRNARLPAQRVELLHGDHTLAVGYRSRRGGSFEIEGIGTARVHAWNTSTIDVEVAGLRTCARVSAAGTKLYVQVPRGTVAFDVLPRFTSVAEPIAGGSMTAPMPGRVLEVRCSPGDTVRGGTTLVVLEAMKMEHHVAAPFDAHVVDVRVAAGEQVDNGAVLVVLERMDADADA